MHRHKTTYSQDAQTHNYLLTGRTDTKLLTHRTHRHKTTYSQDAQTQNYLLTGRTDTTYSQDAQTQLTHRTHRHNLLTRRTDTTYSQDAQTQLTLVLFLSAFNSWISSSFSSNNSLASFSSLSIDAKSFKRSQQTITNLR